MKEHRLLSTREKLLDVAYTVQRSLVVKTVNKRDLINVYIKGHARTRIIIHSLPKRSLCCSNYFKKEELGIKAEGVINQTVFPETRHYFTLEGKRKIGREIGPLSQRQDCI